MFAFADHVSAAMLTLLLVSCYAAIVIAFFCAVIMLLLFVPLLWLLSPRLLQMSLLLLISTALCVVFAALAVIILSLRYGEPASYDFSSANFFPVLILNYKVLKHYKIKIYVRSNNQHRLHRKNHSISCNLRRSFVFITWY